MLAKIKSKNKKRIDFNSSKFMRFILLRIIESVDCLQRMFCEPLISSRLIDNKPCEFLHFNFLRIQVLCVCGRQLANWQRRAKGHKWRYRKDKINIYFRRRTQNTVEMYSSFETCSVKVSGNESRPEN